MSSIPTLEELMRKRKNKANGKVESIVSKELKRLAESGDLTGSIKFKDRDSALEALDILRSKGYYDHVHVSSEGGCKHPNSDCDDCGYESERDNQNCEHYTGDCDCLVWWEVRISLPDSNSDSDSDSD